MKPIYNVDDISEFKDRFVAYTSDIYMTNTDAPIVSKKGVYYGFVRLYYSQSYSIEKLIKLTAIHSDLPITNEHLADKPMSMRLATMEELTSIKEMLLMQQVEFDYTNNRRALCNIQQEIANLEHSFFLIKSCLKEAREKDLEDELQAKWIRDISPKIEFKNCETVGQRMFCPVQDEPQVERVVTWTKRYFDSPEELESDIYLECDEIVPGMSCEGEKTRYTVRQKFASTPTSPPPSILSQLGKTALYAASYTAISEAVGDALYLTGLADATNAKRVKTASQLMLVYLSGSLLPCAASWTTTKILEKSSFISKPNAQLAGQAVGIGMNLGIKLFTPAGIAATVAGVAGGRFGLWAEKKIVSKVCGKNIEDLYANDSPRILTQTN